MTSFWGFLTIMTSFLGVLDYYDEFFGGFLTIMMSCWGFLTIMTSFFGGGSCKFWVP